MYRTLFFASASILSLSVGLRPCAKKTDTADAAADAMASATATADAPKPPPPGDAATSCSALPPLKLVESGGDQEVVFTLKNSGTRPWHYCNVYGFAYDKTGALIGNGSISANYALAPGATGTTDVTFRDKTNKPLPPAVLQTAVFELIPSAINFDDKSEWSLPAFNFYGHTKATGPTATLGGATTTTAPSASTKKPAGKK